MKIESLLQAELDEWRSLGRFVVDSVKQPADDPDWFRALVFGQ